MISHDLGVQTDARSLQLVTKRTHGARGTPGRRDERNLRRCVGHRLDGGEAVSAVESCGVLGARSLYPLTAPGREGVTFSWRYRERLDKIS